MYLVLPFLFLWRKRSVGTLLALLAASIVLRHFLLGSAHGWMSVLEFFPNFLPGILAFTLLEKRTIPSWLWPPFVLLIVAIYVEFHSRRMGIATCLLLGFAIPRFKEIQFQPLRFVSHRIAKYSYGLYLGHLFFIWYALIQHHSWVLFWLLWVFVPPILYYALERPGIRLGEKIAGRSVLGQNARSALACHAEPVSVARSS
jgi:hypothetical protein